jgi:hypothetical protein
MRPSGVAATHQASGQRVSRNGLYAIIVIVVIVVVTVGVYAYRQSQRPSLEVKLDNNGLQINGTGQ